MIIKYPVKYDDINLSVNDANGRVLAIVGWPKITKPMPEIHAIGRLVAESLNAAQGLDAGQIQAIRMGVEQARVDFLDKKDQSNSNEQSAPERAMKRPRGNPNWQKKAVA